MDGAEFTALLYRELVARPHGSTEYDLLEWLREQGLPAFAARRLDDSLGLFQAHFLLFHHLYQLREDLRTRRSGDLEIHCLRIALRPFTEPVSDLPAPPDRLREYYLDRRHLENTEKSEVDALLSGFWQDFQRWQHRPEALAVLGLPLSASEAEIRRRFRQLALQHHPDRGGNPSDFLRINEAATVLLDRGRSMLEEESREN